MKKSHIWETYETIEVKCPYCKSRFEEDHVCMEIGEILICQFCYKDFELGEQR